jgi:hypothetical protein
VGLFNLEEKHKEVMFLFVFVIGLVTLIVDFEKAETGSKS